VRFITLQKLHLIILLALSASAFADDKNEDENLILAKSIDGMYISGSLGLITDNQMSYSNHFQPFYAGMTGDYNTPVTQQNNQTKGLLGVQLGYNWLHNHFLYGAELDFSPSQKTDSYCRGTPDNGNINRCNENGYGWSKIAIKNDYIGSAKLRFGYLSSRFMPYMTAGVAVIKQTNNLSVNCPEGCGPWDSVAFESNTSISKTELRPTVGVGMEYLISPTWRVGVDYQYIKSEKLTQTVFHNSSYPTQAITSTSSGDIDLFKVKLIYAF